MYIDGGKRYYALLNNLCRIWFDIALLKKGRPSLISIQYVGPKPVCVYILYVYPSVLTVHLQKCSNILLFHHRC